jgi:hypothetical protein
MATEEQLNRCVETCLSCYQSCLHTAMNECLVAGGPHLEPSHFRLMMVCAEMCRTAAHVMLTRSMHHRMVCRPCAEICAECAQDCEQIGGME